MPNLMPWACHAWFAIERHTNFDDETRNTMAADRNDRLKTAKTPLRVSFAVASLALLLAGCGSTSLSSLNVFDSKKATPEPPTGFASR